MKIRLLTVSHKQPAWVQDGCAEYEKRLPREWRFEVVELKPVARTQGMPAEKVQAAEAERLRDAMQKGGCASPSTNGAMRGRRARSPTSSVDGGRMAGTSRS